MSKLFPSINRLDKTNAYIEGVILQAKKQVYIPDDEGTLQALRPMYERIYDKPPSETSKDGLCEIMHLKKKPLQWKFYNMNM